MATDCTHEQQVRGYFTVVTWYDPKQLVFEEGARDGVTLLTHPTAMLPLLKQFSISSELHILKESKTIKYPFEKIP